MLLPLDPDGSARRIRAGLTKHLGVAPAVVITDSFGRAWRHGQCDVAIGCAGIAPLDDWRGRRDAVGRELTRDLDRDRGRVGVRGRPRPRQGRQAAGGDRQRRRAPRHRRRRPGRRRDDPARGRRPFQVAWRPQQRPIRRREHERRDRQVPAAGEPRSRRTGSTCSRTFPAIRCRRCIRARCSPPARTTSPRSSRCR